MLSCSRFLWFSLAHAETSLQREGGKFERAASMKLIVVVDGGRDIHAV